MAHADGAYDSEAMAREEHIHLPGGSYKAVIPYGFSGGAANPQAPNGGTWGYNAGTSGTLTLSGGKRVLQISAIAQGAAGSLTINAGDVITLPYDSVDKVSSSIEIRPTGNLVDPTIVFTGTDAYFVEFVS